MAENINDIRLTDYVLAESTTTSFVVENQFPALYREDGRELIELVKRYYEFMETQENQSVYNIRRIYEYRDIDSTLDRMLIFFKNKYMNGLFFQEDTRFLIKHILDLYRRKGSKEGIELFFKLFFDTEVEIYYPSQDIFTPSSSQWKVGTFIQLGAVYNTDIFKGVVNKKVFGDKSRAEAFVDSIYFITINKALIPILFISDVRGEFVGFDVIFSRNPDITYGRVYGSLRNIDIEPTAIASSDNRIGDVVDVTSTDGYGGKARVSATSKELTGEINFDVVSGGYGYTVSNTDIEISTQTFFTADPELDEATVQFIVGETVQQINSSSTLVTGLVIGQSKTSVGVKLDLSTDEATNQPATYFFEGGFEINTVDRPENIATVPIFITEPNGSASVDVGLIENTEDIIIITDLIQNYLDVPLDSANFSAVPPAIIEMSGTRVNDVVPSIATQLNVAFVPESFTLGAISTLSNVNPGTDYFSDVFLVAREDIIRRFNLRDQVLRIVPAAGVILFVGDEIRQQITVETFEGNQVDIQVKGRIVRVEGNNLYVTHLSFASFVLSQPIFKLDSTAPITVTAISRDLSSQPIGLNAHIKGTVQTVTGKIEALEIIDSGFGYADGSSVEIYNTTKAIRDNITPIVPVAQSEGGTFFAEVSKIITGDVTRSIPLESFIKTLGTNDYIYGDISADGILSALDASIFEQIATETASPNNLNMWNRIIVPALRNTQWFQENLDLFVINDPVPDSVGVARSRRQGLTEGRWTSFASQINSNKVLQDSVFYQDYSYEINTDISTSIYETEYRDLLHPSGMKLFTKFTKTDVITIDVTIPDVRVSDLDLETGNQYISDDGVFVSSTNFQYLST